MTHPMTPPLDITATAVRALMLYSLAEFQSGHATTIRVTADGHSFGISDDGRGHPLDKTVEGIAYLDFIYTHFDHPFGSERGAPVQLQGIGMSLINALCSELTLTVRKANETLRVQFVEGRLHHRERTTVPSAETGISVVAVLNPQLQSGAADTQRLEAWLKGVWASSPKLKLFFNGRPLHLPAAGDA